MKILIVKGNIQNAKSYPFWDRLIVLLEDHDIEYVDGIIPLDDIIGVIKRNDVIITIDSFIPHLIRFYNINKKVIVLWGKSDPEIFGYKEHINLLKDRKYLRKEQFKWWIGEPYDKDAFVDPEEIMKSI